MKRGEFLLIFLVLSLILFSPLIFAAESDRVQAGYDCLESRIDSKGCSSLTVEEQVFSLLADSSCKDELIEGMNSNNCWPKTSCNVKSTAQSVFALSERKVDTESSQEWLLTQTMAAQGLEWFLEVETQSPTSCTVKYGSGVYAFNVGADRKINANAGSCLTITSDNPYWYKISPSCFEQEFRVTCDTGFLTTLLFKKQGSDTINVLNDLHSAAAKGETTEVVSARCFKSGTSCDYEGSLWATFALWAEGKDVSKFIPYLTAMKEGNERYLPESFLYFMTGKFYAELLDKQKYNSYWEESGNRYYDTALALWPLKYDNSFQKDYAKDWILNAQDSSGCWHGGNLVDTAFILRSLWPEYAPECRTNNDCFNGKVCNITTNTCYLPDNNNDDNECDIDDDCPIGQHCSSSGECYTPSEYECGNNIVEPGEQCDGSDLNDKTCSDILNSAWSGTISCFPSGTSNECNFDTSQCYQSQPECEDDGDCEGDKVCNSDGICVNPNNLPECGNNVKEDGEQCDGIDYNGKTCEVIFGEGWSGDLSCGLDCTLITDGCKEETECTFNFQCPGTEICDDGTCVEPTEPPCENDFDCSGDLICDNGDCVEQPTSESCTIDSDCTVAGLEVCLSGTCVECGDDWDCPGTDICSDSNICVSQDVVCVDDWDCPGTQECVAGNCIEPGNNGDTPETCVTDFDCPGTQICVDKICSDNEIYDCEDSGYFCMSESTCDGNILPLYSGCYYPFKCCDTSLPSETQTCFQKNGEICLSDESCVGGLESNASDLESGEVCCVEGSCVSNGVNSCETDFDCASDESCIDGVCEYSSESPSCESNGGHCRLSCSDGEEEKYTYSCEYSGDSCCMSSSKPGGSGKWLLVVLLILIAMVVVGIVFRDKLKVYWLKVKSNFGKGSKSRYHRRPPRSPPSMHNNSKKKGFFDKIKDLFKGKKSSQPGRPQNINTRPLRGPLAIQHAQRQASQMNHKGTNVPGIPSNPLPKKSTETPFSQKPKENLPVKKPGKKSSKELDEVLEKLKKMGK